MSEGERWRGEGKIQRGKAEAEGIFLGWDYGGGLKGCDEAERNHGGVRMRCGYGVGVAECR